MHESGLIQTLTGSLVAALVFGYLAQRLRLSPIVGYLLAGIAVGRHTPGFAADPGIANQLADIGVVLLMFGVGLQLHVRDLVDVRRVVLPGALIQTAASAAMGAVAGRAFGWDWPAAIIFGFALSVGSTVVAVRVLSDNRDLHTVVGHLAVGWLIVEDVLTVVLLVFLHGLFGPSAPTTAWELALVTGLKVTGVVALMLVAGGRAIRWLLDRVAAARSRELFTLAVLALALGIAAGSAALFGISMALGAFLAGTIVGQTDYSLRAASEALPMRDAFAVLFFVSIGMLLDPRDLLEFPALGVVTLAIVVLGKPLVAAGVAVMRGVRGGVALRVGVALGQIGEFSFMLAALGRQLGILSASAMTTIVTASIVSIVINEPLYRGLATLEGSAWWRRRFRTHAALDPARAPDESSPGSARSPDRQAVIVGSGPTGRTLARLLRDNGISPVVIELNVSTVRRLKEEGVPVVHGDAGRRDVLAAAGVRTALYLIISADLQDSREVIRLARELNGGIQVLARTTHLRDVKALRAAGANRVFSGEGEVALALTEAVLQDLGATPEQVDRERERAHREIFG